MGMFVLEKTYRKLEREHYQLRLIHDHLVGEWNSLVRKINSKGGAAFLDSTANIPMFDGEDIKRLLMLCHPDKHGGKKMAEEMTQKLLAMRQ